MLPIAINVQKKDRIVEIEWDDSHHSIFEFGLLRAACPCATCRGGHENMKAEPDSDVFDKILPDSEMTRIQSIELVGTYAVSITWEDGHHYGIYNWPFLRLLCNCDQCASKRANKLVTD